MKKIIFGMLATLVLTTSVHAGKGKKNRKKAAKAETCTPATCDKTQCPPNCVGMPCCK